MFFCLWLCLSLHAQVTPLRLMASSMSGQWLKLDGFQEYPDPITGVTKQWCSLAQGGGDICMLNPYPASNSVQVMNEVEDDETSKYIPERKIEPFFFFVYSSIG